MFRLYLLLTLFLVNAKFTLSQTITFETPANITEKEIREELSVYSPKMLKMVKTIKLQKLGENVSGAAGINYILLAGDYPKSVIISTLHHELSTVFLQMCDMFKTYDIIMNQFYALNASEVSYYNNKGQEFVSKPIVELTEVEKNYFVKNSYAKSSSENDFNTICEELFTNGKTFIANIKAKPETIIYKKVMIVINFYHSMDSKFAIDFFETR